MFARHPSLSHALLPRLQREDGLALAAIRTLRAQRMPSVDRIASSTVQYLGQHMLLEFQLAPHWLENKIALEKKSPEQIIQAILVKAANAAQATILKEGSFKQNNDISAIVVIQESHFSGHYLHANFFLDAYTCGDIDFKKAVDLIQEELNATPYDQVEFKRGVRQNTDGGFVTGIASQERVASDLRFFKNRTITKPSALGQHAVIEFYGCNPSRINDATFVMDAFQETIAAAGGEVLLSCPYQFKPQGASGAVMGKHFHLTGHTWPEADYMAIDLCTFADTVNPQVALQYLSDQFQPQKSACHYFPRGAYQTDSQLLTPVFEEILPVEVPYQSCRKSGK